MSDLIGVKQVIKKKWLDKAIACAGHKLSIADAKSEILASIYSTPVNLEECTKGDTAAKQAANIIVNCWVSPRKEIEGFRDYLLDIYKSEELTTLTPIHWAMISTAYPFWFNTAMQFGRLFLLQDLITNQQIMRRLKENYGDRETVTRYGRNVIRSFVDWGVIGDALTKGSYESIDKIQITSEAVACGLLESVLIVTKYKNMGIDDLRMNPGLFPFEIPVSLLGELQKNTKRLSKSKNHFGDTLFSVGL